MIVGGVAFSPYIVLIFIRTQCVLVQYITVVIGMLCTAFHIDSAKWDVCYVVLSLILKGHCKYSEGETS